MDINWLGHSCFKIKGKEAVLVTDPCSPQTGYALGKVKADIVTVSHNHPGHSYLDGLEGEYKVIKSPGEYELKGVFVTGIATHHDKVDGQERGNNNVYVIEIDGITICHMGDIGHLLSSKIIEDIGSVGILLLPVGGLSTIDSTVAAEMVRTMSPRIVIPMHYKTAAVSRELEPVDKFLKKLGINESVSQPKLSINKSTFTESTQVIVLNYPNQ
ncbi:MAG: hypothetical protein A2Z02_05060 [Chloroflexi bacterium RBG_16_48_7]|nr:MAG: hypothetical protein A2Z02_05060 [Chloroflexi bacterium RBG_16_48_7]